VAGYIKLAKSDAEISVDDLNITGDKTVEVDLNKNTLDVVHPSKVRSTIELKSKDNKISFKNGNINAVKNNPSETDNKYCLFIKCGSFKLDHIIYTSNWGTALGMQGNFTTGEVIDSEITAKYMAIGSNASLNANGESVYGHGATLNLTNSKFSAGETGMLNNVPSTVNITNCEFTGKYQGAFLRGGTYTINGSKFTLNAVYSGSTSGYGSYGVDGNRTDDCRNNVAWGSGCAAPFAALVIGNQTEGSYAYVTNVTFSGDKSTGVVTGDYKAQFPAAYIYGVPDYKVTVKGDMTGFKASGYSQNVVTGGNVNDSKAEYSRQGESGIAAGKF
jgi:hypothetical protein